MYFFRECKRNLLVILCLCFVSAYSFAQTSDKRISLQCKNESLSTVLEKIEGLSDFYKIQFAQTDVAPYTISAEIHDKTVPEALSQILDDLPLEFSIDKQTIQISKTSSETLDHTICGKVVDENGDPLPGVLIRIGGNIMSTQTDDMGNFLLKTSDSKKTYKAVLSFIGKRKMTRILKVGKKQVITMEDDVNTIPEVVLTGYQTIDKRLMSSATTTVKMDDIKIPNVNSLDKMLQGAIPGVMVQNVSGSPNATPKIRVRGTSTIFGNASPLWVVDGVIHDDPVNFSNNVLNDIIAGSGSDMSDQVNLNASRSLLGMLSLA
mgnify:CR=1 FL=1